MPITKEVIYTESLSCNCPECYSTSGLILAFYQEWKETLFLKKATDIVREQLSCKQCQEIIYPIKWTDDIERLYEYHKKKTSTMSYFRLKAATWIAIVVVLFVIAGIILLLARS